MDNKSSTISELILDSTNSQPNIISSETFSSSSDSGFFDMLKNINASTWIIVILILAFLGFNIFVYLAKGTQDLTNFFGPFLQKIFGTVTSVAGETIDVSAEGAKAVVSGTANVVNSGLTTVQNITPNQSTTSIKSQSVQNTIHQPDNLANASLNKAINSSKNKTSGDEYEANEASSSLYAGSSTGKSGWCYIGEDRGFRSCAKVGINDKCMSGDIFPSQELCINPTLRA